MSDLKYAIDIILKQEGGLVDDPRDKGGITNYGVSLRLLQQIADQSAAGLKEADLNKDGVVDALDIKNMTRAQAFMLYQDRFWLKYKYFQIENQPLGTKALSLSINMGPTMAAKVYQRAVRAASGVTLVDDGILGQASISEINKCNAQLLMVAVKAEAASFYRQLVQEKPQYKGFLAGWLNRAYDNCAL
ncbi:MAG: hypothetical protein K5Q00_00185 [Gammaproteobacteria bacterium]|nr:hypothetical protein [Gammaproteobacteria bacterium]